MMAVEAMPESMMINDRSGYRSTISEASIGYDGTARAGSGTTVAAPMR